MNTEIVILTNLLHNEEYFQRVLPFLKSEYFSDLGERTVFEKMASFADTYGEPPTPDAIRLALQKDSTLTDALFNETIDLVDALVPTERLNVDWLLDETEEFCRKKALRNAIHQSMKVMEGNDKTLSPDAIPSLLQDALAITFDPSVGHDYTEDVDERYDNYHQVQERIPFSVDMFNTVTRGGIPKKTLNVIMAGVGVGKTIFMCDFAANAFLAGKNVLYITLEMSDHSIAERIDANLIGVNVDDLPSLDREVLKKRVNFVKSRTTGKLIIKEYPTKSANVNHFYALLKELEIKKRFKPDVLIVDYLNLCDSATFKKADQSYGFVKAVAEELRGLGGREDIAILSATQLTREGYSSSDADMTNVAESWGVPATADFFALLFSDDDLAAKGHILVKQLKNRYRDVNKDKRFLVGLQKDQMRFFNLEADAVADTVSALADKDRNASETVKKFFTTGKKFKSKALDYSDDDEE